MFFCVFFLTFFSMTINRKNTPLIKGMGKKAKALSNKKPVKSRLSLLNEDQFPTNDFFSNTFECGLNDEQLQGFHFDNMLRPWVSLYIFSVSELSFLVKKEKEKKLWKRINFKISNLKDVGNIRVLLFFNFLVWCKTSSI